VQIGEKSCESYKKEQKLNLTLKGYQAEAVSNISLMTDFDKEHN
jgi:hypothetical protein